MSRSRAANSAIDNAHAWLAEDRRGDPAVPKSAPARSREQLGRAVDRVMAEGSLYDRDLAALAIKQAAGRSDRGRLPAARLPHHPAPLRLRRAGGHRRDADPPPHLRRVQGPAGRPDARPDLPTTPIACSILPSLPAATAPPPAPQAPAETRRCRACNDLLGHEDLIERDGTSDGEPGDLTREPLTFPAGRDVRLQALARGDEGFLLALGYSTQRGWGGTHPFVGEIRIGDLPVEIAPPELGFAIDIGDVTVTECQMVNQFEGIKTVPPQFTRGYGLAFGQAERNAMSMALVDRAMRAEELGEDVTRARAEHRVRAVPLRQYRGDRLRRASEAAALRRFPERAGKPAPDARRAAAEPRGRHRG